MYLRIFVYISAIPNTTLTPPAHPAPSAPHARIQTRARPATNSVGAIIAYDIDLGSQSPVAIIIAGVFVGKCVYM